MGRHSFIFYPSSFILALLVVFVFAQASGETCWAQTVESKAQGKDAKKLNPELLKKYVGRYELETGIIPISTLDVTIENGELWVKPSVIKKRRIVPKSRGVFLDEVEGTRYAFNKDEEGKIVSLTFEFEGSSYTAQRVVLPPPSLKGNTTFRLKGYADAQVVALAGSFNNWNQSQLIFGREGDVWVCRLDLNPGKHTYKFIVDGNWLLDPDNPNTEEDEAGNTNSVLIVGDK
ncbi:MAG: hypothetical protein WBP93_17890 [Pyrinomonadaceae bacterium]